MQGQQTHQAKKKKNLFLQKANAADIQVQIRLWLGGFTRKSFLRKRFAFRELSGEIWWQHPERSPGAGQLDVLSAVPSTGPQFCAGPWMPAGLCPTGGVTKRGCAPGWGVASSQVASSAAAGAQAQGASAPTPRTPAGDRCC